MRTNIQYNEKIYEVEFDFIRGSHGDYMNPPEPHDLFIESIIGEGGEYIDDAEVWDYVDQEIYDQIDNEEF